MKKCLKCGAENTDNASYCNLCLNIFPRENLTKENDSNKDDTLKEIEKKVEKTGNQPVSIQGISFNLFIPSIVAAAGAFLLTLALPKGQTLFTSGKNPLFIIALTAISGGWVLISNYKTFDLKKILTKFLIGASSVLLSFIFIIFFMMITIKVNKGFFNRFALPFENLILPLVLTVAFAFSDQIDKFELKRFLKQAAFYSIGGLAAFFVTLFLPVIHSFVIVGLLCWVMAPVAKKRSPKLREN